MYRVEIVSKVSSVWWFCYLWELSGSEYFHPQRAPAEAYSVRRALIEFVEAWRYPETVLGPVLSCLPMENHTL